MPIKEDKIEKIHELIKSEDFNLTDSEIAVICISTRDMQELKSGKIN